MGWSGHRFKNDPPPNISADTLYDDPLALVEYREWKTRQKFIDIEKSKILRDRVKKCYKEEGVNHLQLCRQHVENYMESIKNVGNHVQNSGKYDLNRDQMKAQMP